MVAEIKQAVVDRLHELFTAEVYDEAVPQESAAGSFFIAISEHSCRKAIADRFTSSVSFDLSYYPADSGNIRKECMAVGETALRGLDLAGGFRITGKTAQIVENVLHVRFTVKYREGAAEAADKMNKLIFE